MTTKLCSKAIMKVIDGALEVNINFDLWRLVRETVSLVKLGVLLPDELQSVCERARGLAMHGSMTVTYETATLCT